MQVIMVLDFYIKIEIILDDENIYVVTCDHLLGNDNLTSFFASFNTVDNTRTNVSTTAEFRVVGRDRFTDILVGI